LKADERLAIYSFHPRDWWSLPAAGANHVPMGSYALLLKPAIILKEGLSFRSVPTRDARIRNGTGYWDTGDYCQKQLIERGYRIEIAPPNDRQLMPTFFGASSGFVTFARRHWFGDGYRARWRGDRLTRELQTDSYLFQRACAVAATTELYEQHFAAAPRFREFPRLGELASIAEAAGADWVSARNHVVQVRDRLMRKDASAAVALAVEAS
jgi:hypothetical protein